MAIATRSDVAITADVVAELTWDPAVKVAYLVVSTLDGYVILSGRTATYTSKDAAEVAVYRVLGVLGVANNILVEPAAGLRSDTDIAADVRAMLALNTDVPPDRVGVAVSNGTVTLTGNLDHHYQRAEAEAVASQISGVLSVVDLVTVTPPAPIAADVADGIARAFARNAELADDKVSVTVDGSKVTLDGTVRTWSEYAEAGAAARRAPGVSIVVNNILVMS
jgi:osmotically-inducible protein OsmY